MSILSALDELKKVEKMKQTVVNTPKPKPTPQPKLTPQQIANLQKMKESKQKEITDKAKKDKAEETLSKQNSTPKVPYGTKGNLKTPTGENIPRIVNPIAAGITKVASFGTSSLLPGMKEAEAQAQKQFPKSYIAGQVLGYAGPTGLATGLTKGLVKGATKKLATETGKRVVEGAIVGTTAEATQIVKPLITKEITPEQAAKQLATGLVAGAGLDIGIGVLGKALKALPKPTMNKIKSGATLSNAEKNNIVAELGLPKGTTADDYIRQMQDLANEFEVENYYKQTERAENIAQQQALLKLKEEISKPSAIIRTVKETELPPIPKIFRGTQTLKYKKGDILDVYGDKYTVKSVSGNRINVIDQATGNESFIPADVVGQVSKTGKVDVNSFYKERANELMGDLDSTVKAERFPILHDQDKSILSYTGTKRLTSDSMAIIKDETKATYAEIRRALNDIKNGEYKTVLSQKIIKTIEQDLEKGYSVNGYDIQPNKAYQIAKESNLPSKTPSLKRTPQEAGSVMREYGFEFDTPNRPLLEAPTQQQIVKPIMAQEQSLVKPITQSVEQPIPIVKPLVEPTVESKVKTSTIEPQGVKSVSENIGNVPKAESLNIPLREPSDRVANVLTDMPKKSNVPLKEKAARGYQMFVSSDLPLERIGRQNEKVTNLASTLRSVGGSVDYNLETALTDIEGNEVGKSLFSVFKDVPEVNKKDLFEYSLHKHNIDRYEQGKPVFGDTVDTNVSKNRLAELSANPQLEEKSKEITEYMNGLMNNWALKSGLVNEDTLKTLNQMYPNYVPTYRNKEGVKPIVGGSKGSVSNTIKKATGGSSDILPLDQQMAMLTNKVIRASRKNELYNSLYDTFDKNPEFAERWFKPITKETTDLAEGIDGIASTFDEPIKKVGDTYELSFFRNGEKVKAEISKDLYEAIKPLNQLSNIEEVAAFVKKYGTNPFKSLITTYNPIFIVRNIMRDIPTAFLYSNDALAWSKNMPIAFKEIVSNGGAWREYRAMGGARSGIFSYDKPTQIAFKGGKQNIVSKGAKGVVNGIETMNNLTETLPRFAEYLATVKKGGGTYESKLEGIMRASEITTDFGRGGKATKFADSFVPYLNPSVQGIDKFARQAVKHPLKTAIKGGLVISTPTLILDYINKDNQAYQELTEREKNQYYLIPKDDGTFIRIPKAREVGVVFSTMLDWIMRRSRGEEVKPSEIASTIKENFTPVNMVENNLVAPLYKALQQIKDPSRDVKNYAGISIVPTALKKYEPKEQYDAYTSEVAKQIGQVAGISPKVADYIMRSYGGILGQTLLPKTSPTQRGLVESSFTTDPVFKSGNVNKFYDELDKQTQELAKQKRIDEDNVDADLKKRVKELNAVSRELSDLRKEQRAIDIMGISAEEKKKKIRELQIKMNDITRTALKGAK